MSEPVKNDGIEDVLSSIRRLVSEDTRGAAVPPAASPPNKPEALVLTPALRVPEPDPEADVPDAEEVSEKLQFVRAARPAPAAEAPEEGVPWRKPGTTLFAAAGGVSEEAVSSSSLKEKIAALEAVIGSTEDQWEPDGDSADAYAGTNVEPLTWEDSPAEAEETLDAAHLAEEAATAETLEALAEEETLIDEASLRELVADIVREELQGALGERITRNVRKLVRREIHRALAVQDLG